MRRKESGEGCKKIQVASTGILEEGNRKKGQKRPLYENFNGI